jgi:hypothetical protein
VRSSQGRWLAWKTGAGSALLLGLDLSGSSSSARRRAQTEGSASRTPPLTVRADLGSGIAENAEGASALSCGPQHRPHRVTQRRRRGAMASSTVLPVCSIDSANHHLPNPRGGYGAVTSSSLPSSSSPGNPAEGGERPDSVFAVRDGQKREPGRNDRIDEIWCRSPACGGTSKINCRQDLRSGREEGHHVSIIFYAAVAPAWPGVAMSF